MSHKNIKGVFPLYLQQSYHLPYVDLTYLCSYDELSFFSPHSVYFPLSYPIPQTIPHVFISIFGGNPLAPVTKSVGSAVSGRIGTIPDFINQTHYSDL